MSTYLKLLIIILGTFYVSCIDPGPKYKPTKGEVWPAPQHEIKSNTYHKIEFENLIITKPYQSCDILEEGIKRLIRDNLVRKQSLLNVSEKMKLRRNLQTRNDIFSRISFIEHKIEFRIELMKQCEHYPHFEMEEAYILNVSEVIKLTSTSIWGILRGMETFNQLIYYSDDFTEMRINSTHIIDYPAYAYRGLLIDTGRHYLQPETIHSLIDAMEMNKMNVLHWHIVDDQSFPYESTKFPELSKKGAFHSTMVYTKQNIQQIIERARLAGIRVIPEFDVPGHVRSWGEAFPEILTECYKGNKITGLGPLNPINNKTYSFIKEIYAEVSNVFPDLYIHIGGDEVDTNCWASNPIIQAYLQKYHVKDINKLHAQFMSKVKTLLPPDVKFILWQDVFDAGVPLPKKTLLQVWRYEWISEMDKILKAGHRVIFSSSWYLDEINVPWENYYRADPRQMMFIKRLNVTGLDYIVGGEACMWGEKVDDTNIFPRIWPRASAVAERLWTGMNFSILPPDPVTDHVRSRIEEHTCRMKLNGIPAEPPNGPGFCFGSVSEFQIHRRARSHRRRQNKIGILDDMKRTTFWESF